MATTPAPIVWDFQQEIGPVDNLGGNVHYFETSAQRLYLHNGIATNVTEVPEGRWVDAVYGDEIIIDDTPYTLLSVDHPYNGILFMVATDGESLYYLRYVYAMEISHIISAGSWKEQADSREAQMSLTCKNIGAPTFADQSTLFNPGAKLTLAFAMGDSNAYDVGVAYVDDVDFDEYSETVPLSGRNSISSKLKEQTMDELTEITGYAHEVAAAILEHAGITKYLIQPGTHEWTHHFKPEQTCLSAMIQLAQFYSPEALPWDFVELPDGTIVAGYANWIRQPAKLRICF
jgi:hypothetical protein